MKALHLLFAGSSLLIPAIAMAQAMDHSHHMPGMAMPPTAQAPVPAQLAPLPADPDCPPEHAAMGHCKPKVAVPQRDDRAGVDHSPAGTALPAGNAPAPAPVTADYADRIWGAGAMVPVRAGMMKEHGGMSFSQVMLNIAEIRPGKGRDAFAWDGEAWFGGDLNRLTIKSEGEGAFSGALDTAEVQALYSRAIGPYFNLQAGIRQDIRPRPARTWATIGFEGLAPYWFEVEGALFLSDKGDLAARFEAYYDQRITQRLVLQPRAELNLSAQAMPAAGIGSGLTDAEAGLRLRYEVAREFAPYVGVHWERKFGDTARFFHQAGESTGGIRFVAGIRTWF